MEAYAIIFAIIFFLVFVFYFAYYFTKSGKNSALVSQESDIKKENTTISAMNEASTNAPKTKEQLLDRLEKDNA